MSLNEELTAQLTEDYLVEQPAINWLKELGYNYIHGSELNPENRERESYRDVILKRRFMHAIKRINPWLDDFLAEEVYKKVTHLEHPDFVVKLVKLHLKYFLMQRCYMEYDFCSTEVNNEYRDL